MIPEYNKINFETDDLSIVEAKKKILEIAVESGQITPEEFQEEKDRVNKVYEKYMSKLGYAFTWLAPSK